MGDYASGLSNDWKELENTTFLAWVNHHLEPRGLVVRDFSTDLSDGLILIALLEVLSGVKFIAYQKNPRHPAQKMSNISEAFAFMTRHYGIKLVGCSAQDIMEGKRNQCMGVIFVLIKKIKALKSQQLDEVDESVSSGTSGEAEMASISSPRKTESEMSPRQSHPKTPSKTPVSTPRNDTPTSSTPTKSTNSVSPTSSNATSTGRLPSVGKRPLVSRDASASLSASSERQKPSVPPRPRGNTSLDPEKADAALAQIASELDPLQKKKLVWTVVQTAARGYLARKAYSKKMSDSKAIVKKISSDPNSLKKIIRLQACIRGMILRNTPALRTRRKRNDICQEILQTEISYTSSLNVLSTLYVPAVKAIPNLPANAMRSIFSELEVIVRYNNHFKNNLQTRLTEQWYQKNQCLGDIFLELVIFFRTYTMYVSNYSTAINTLQELSTNLPGFSETLLRCRADSRSNGMELVSYLIMPIQRIPRYVMLLSEIFRCTPQEHPDYQNLKKALKSMEEVATYVNDKIKEGEQVQVVHTILNRIMKHDSVEVLKKLSGRRFIRHSALQEFEGGTVSPKYAKNRIFFLFSDILVIAKEQTGVLGFSGSKYKDIGTDLDSLIQSDIQFKHVSNISLESAEFDDLPDVGGFSNLLEIRESFLNTGRHLVISAPSATIKTEWIYALDETIMNLVSAYRSRDLASYHEDINAILTNPDTIVDKTPTISGTLLKRTETDEWKENWYTLIEDVLFCYPDSSCKGTPKITHILTGSVFLIATDSHAHSFKIAFKDGISYFRANDNSERLKWVQCIRKAICVKLNNLKVSQTISHNAPHVNTSIGGVLLAETKRLSGKQNEPEVSKDTPSTSVTPPVATVSTSQPATSEKRTKSRHKKTSVEHPSPSVTPTATPTANETDESVTTIASVADEVLEEKKATAPRSSKTKKAKKKLQRDQTLSKISKTGEIYKITSKVGKYRLTLMNGELALYKLGKSKPMALIDLLLVQSPNMEINKSVVKESTYFTFEVLTSDRKYTFGSDNEDESVSWVENISLAHQALHRTSVVNDD